MRSSENENLRRLVSGGFSVKFIVGSSAQAGEKLQEFPRYYAKFFASSKILVIAMNNRETVAACGVSNLSNFIVIYVKETYRGKGLGTRLEWTTINEARGRGLNFVARAMSNKNIPSLRIARRMGYREITQFKNYDYIVMMIPFDFAGEALYALLHGLCLLLPEEFLASIVKLLMSIVAWVQR